MFGTGEGNLPGKATDVTMELIRDLDLSVKWNIVDAVGYNVLWGFSQDKLYHSHMVFDSNTVKIGALIKGHPVYVRVDTFNEKGITEGEVIKGV